jgi:hypothetical protein
MEHHLPQHICCRTTAVSFSEASCSLNCLSHATNLGYLWCLCYGCSPCFCTRLLNRYPICPVWLLWMPSWWRYEVMRLHGAAISDSVVVCACGQMQPFALLQSSSAAFFVVVICVAWHELAYIESCLQDQEGIAQCFMVFILYPLC